MRVTPGLARGFWGRSFDELKRLSNIGKDIQRLRIALRLSCANIQCRSPEI